MNLHFLNFSLIYKPNRRDETLVDLLDDLNAL